MFDSHFDPSSTIAMFIAAALQHPNPPCNGHNKRVSTIHVEQYKNKFNEVIVYCTLADDKQVLDAWRESGNEGEYTPEFRHKCLLNDAKHYRKCYRKMLRLVPQYHDMIMGRPDHSMLLQDDIVKLDQFLSYQNASMNKKRGEDQRLLNDWGVSTSEELRSLICKICDFK